MVAVKRKQSAPVTSSTLIFLLCGAAVMIFSAGAVTYKKIGIEKREVQEGGAGASTALAVAEPPMPVTPRQKAGGVLNGVQKPAVAGAKKTPDPALPTRPQCGGAAYEEFTCWRRYYTDLTQKKGSEAAMADIRSHYIDPFVRAQCHQLTHAVGRVAAERYPSVAVAFAHGDSFCWSGYYHGVMETAVAGVAQADVAKKLDTFCSEIPGKERFSFDYYNCVHGLGHGAMAILHNELPQSLELCDNLSGAWEQRSCWSGAFMENIIADEVNHFSKYLKADDPYYPCDIVKDMYKGTCYLMQTSRMLALTGSDFKKVFALCADAEEPYAEACYQSLGRDASGRSVSDPAATKKTCMLGESERARTNCVIGAVKDFISYHHSDIQAKVLCASLPQELQETCYSTAKNYYILF